jgi:integrase/recombinase XerC
MGMDRLIRTFLERLASEKGYSPHTLYAYESDLHQFQKFVGEREWSESLFEDYVEHLKQTYSESGVARRISSLRSFLKYLDGQGYPVPGLPKTFTPKNIRRREVPDIEVKSIRDWAIIDLMKLGLKPHQIVDLRIRDCSDDGLIIRGKNGKIDIVPYPDSVNYYLNNRPLSKCDHLFLSMTRKALLRQDVWLIGRRSHFPL